MDFLILYEHASRELENACLLKEELNRRGYSVKIECIYSIKKLFCKPKVLIVPHLYNDNQIVDFAYNFFGGVKKIVDLQYEQVLSKSDIEDNYNMPKEHAKFAYHIAWGEDQYRRYLENEISEGNIIMAGCMSMDLNHKKFDSVFIDRSEISKKYGLPNNKWRIFISSFTLHNRTEDELKRYENVVKSTRELRRIMIESRSKILEWIELILKKYPNEIFIYRPHPAERADLDLKELEEKYNNFYVISDLSIRQWVRVVDYAYTWYSTSIVDFYYGNKNCEILRPIKIPEKIDAILFKNARVINTVGEFEYYFNMEASNLQFPIDDKEIEEFYGHWKDGSAYKRIADACEKVIKSQSNSYGFINNISNFKGMNIKKLIMFMSYEACKFVKLSILFHNILPEKYILGFERAENEMYKKKKLEKFYTERFKMILKLF